MSFLNAKNLMIAYKKARKSRKEKQEVYLFEQQLEARLLKLLDDLKTKTYIHGDYKQIVLIDSKKRYIYSPVFRDHILHYMVYNEIYKVLDRRMVFSTFACRKGYGSHKSLKYLQELIFLESRNAGYDNLYYLKLDFSKYFFSINHELLKRKIFKHIKNLDLQYTINLIIDSYATNKVYDELLKDYDFYINGKQKGLPIGGLISQLFANFYLNDLDQFLKHKLKVKFIRYMDDIVIIGDKDKLNKVKKQVYEFVKKEKLILNPKKISFNKVRDGVKFVGYKIQNHKIYVGKKAREKTNRFIDTLNNLKQEVFGKNDIKRIDSSLQSRLGVFSHCSFGLNYFKERLK